ncbi:restriction endonuclease [Methylomagnum sp.]
MGGMNFGPGALADRLSEVCGYKAGLALSIDELCDHLYDTEYQKIIRDSEKSWIRFRSEEYEALFYKLLFRIGHTKEEYNGDHTGAYLFHKYRKSGLLAEYQEITKTFNKILSELVHQVKIGDSKSISPDPIIIKCQEQHGAIGAEIALEKLLAFHQAVTFSPFSVGRSIHWNSTLNLSKLFRGTAEPPEYGRFIDRRFIDYLSNNTNKLPNMHWRKFEELIAEFFDHDEYKVALGPGSNDDGVDIRVWKADSTPTENPLFLIQCKRQKAKVERVIIKGLYADVQYEGAEYGLIVTTSELSPAARTTISARGYPIYEVNLDSITEWLKKLRFPGTGIVRV